MPATSNRLTPIAALSLVLSACTPGVLFVGGTARQSEDDSGSEGDAGEDAGVTMRLDTGEVLICEEGAWPGNCDADTTDPWRSIGLSCAGGVPVDVSYAGRAEQRYVHPGPLGPFEPRQGARFLVLSTGIAQDIVAVPGTVSCEIGDPSNCPSSDLQGPSYAADDLPAPLDVFPVDEDDASNTCDETPALVGAGDCSNTIWDQWKQACGEDPDLGIECDPGREVAFDYAAARIDVDLPQNINSISFDVAYATAEFPNFSGQGFNDMFVAWLESENWTGNISFDEQGNALSLEASFLDFTGDDPELEGFGLQGHAATKWLNTTTSVEPGESLTLVFALFDVQDPIVDSYVLLDNFQFGCDEGVPPTTKPIP